MGGPKFKPVACRKHKTLRGCGNLTFDKLRDLKPIWIAMTGRPPGPDDCAVNLHAIGWSPLGGRHQKQRRAVAVGGQPFGSRLPLNLSNLPLAQQLGRFGNSQSNFR
jgi:hypothetical protein